MELDIYAPYQSNKKKEDIMSLARKTNEERDKIERNAGFASPPDLPLDGYLRNAISAISSGLSTLKSTDKSSINCIAEGLAMIQDIEAKVRKHLL